MNKLIIGLDVGYFCSSTWATLINHSDGSLLDVCCVYDHKSIPMTKRSTDSLAKKRAVISIYKWLLSVLGGDTYDHDEIVIVTESVFISKNINSALKLSNMQGAIEALCYLNAIECKTIVITAPSIIKWYGLDPITEDNDQGLTKKAFAKLGAMSEIGSAIKKVNPLLTNSD